MPVQLRLEEKARNDVTEFTEIIYPHLQLLPDCPHLPPVRADEPHCVLPRASLRQPGRVVQDHVDLLLVEQRGRRPRLGVAAAHAVEDKREAACGDEGQLGQRGRETSVAKAIHLLARLQLVVVKQSAKNEKMVPTGV